MASSIRANHCLPIGRMATKSMSRNCLCRRYPVLRAKWIDGSRKLKLQPMTPIRMTKNSLMKQSESSAKTRDNLHARNLRKPDGELSARHQPFKPGIEQDFSVAE